MMTNRTQMEKGDSEDAHEGYIKNSNLRQRGRMTQKSIGYISMGLLFSSNGRWARVDSHDIMAVMLL